MGGVSIWHWLVVLIAFGCLIWFLNSTTKLLAAAGLSKAWALVVFIPFFGGSIVQHMLAVRLAAKGQGSKPVR